MVGDLYAMRKWGVHDQRVKQEDSMKRLRYVLLVLWMLLFSVTYARAEVSVGIGLPNVNIGINLPIYPELVRVPNYPVYYAPQMDANYFFYDGMYWVYRNDTWYASSWYNGPWSAVDRYAVPLYILRIPVRYYRQPPVYFRGWVSNAPPRWGQHWGHGWEQRRNGWDHWNHNSAPSPAPLPVYQRQYSGDHYPRIEQQHTLRNQHYQYQPHDKVIRQHLQQIAPKTPAAAKQPVRQETPAKKASHQQNPPQVHPAVAPQQQKPAPHAAPPPQAHPAVQHQQQGVPHAAPPQQPAAHRQQEQKPQERQQQPEHGRGQDNDEGRGHK